MADPRVEMLRTVPLFTACNDKQLSFIATQVEEMDLAAERDLCREGDSGGEFFVIVSGAADVIRKGKTIDTLGPGQFFGEIALIDRGPRTATVRAKTPMRCLVLSPSQFQNVIQQDASIAVAILRTVGERLRALLGGQAV